MVLYVKGLDYQATEQDLLDLFGPYGKITRVSLPRDLETGRGRGIAFITMDAREALAAMAAISGMKWHERTLGIEESTGQRRVRPLLNYQTREVEYAG